MSKVPKVSRKPSSFRLNLMQRLRVSWTSWHLRLILRRQEKAQRRLVLLQVELDNQLLLLRWLAEQQDLLQLVQQERMESLLYRRQGELMPVPEEEPTELDLLLFPKA